MDFTIKDYFYKPIKINTLDSDILFWGCLHYGHDPCWPTPIWKRRGYSSSQEHDEGIINNWNVKANKNTIGFLLGDNTLGKSSKEKFVKLITNINFSRLYVMSGNHAAGWHNIFDTLEGNVWHINDKEVIFVPNYMEIIAKDQFIVLSHYPLVSWNMQRRGSFMIHSHCHGSLYPSNDASCSNGIGDILYKGKIIDIGVEVSPFPKNLKEIRKLLNDKEIFSNHRVENKN